MYTQLGKAGQQDKGVKVIGTIGYVSRQVVPGRDTSMKNSYFFILLHTYYGRRREFLRERTTDVYGVQTNDFMPER